MKRPVWRGAGLGALCVLMLVVVVVAGSAGAAVAVGSVLAFRSNELGELGPTTNLGTAKPNPTPAVVASAASPPSYSVVPLTASNVGICRITGINGNGDIVGEAVFDKYPANQNRVYPFFWHAGTFTQLLSDNLRSPGTGTCADLPASTVYAVNDKGQMVGTAFYHGDNQGAVEVAERYQPAGRDHPGRRLRRARGRAHSGRHQCGRRHHRGNARVPSLVPRWERNQ